MTETKDDAVFADADPTQIELMEEKIIVTDIHDKALRPGSKKECHLNTNIAKGLLHRAFSVFLFNSEGKLMLQQRSDKKITFPLYWANTCCSHPLWTPEEMELENALGVKRAAIRKLEHELGIKPTDLDVSDFHFLTRIHYEAQEEGTWGEHEIDHVLVIQKDVEAAPVPNEVKTIRYFSEEELNQFLADADKNGDLISPWFSHIQKKFVSSWWKALRENKISEMADHTTIHRFKIVDGVGQDQPDEQADKPDTEENAKKPAENVPEGEAPAKKVKETEA